MKRLVLVLMAAGLFAAMPVLAEESGMTMEHEGLRQCALQAESIQQKVKRLETEVAKGEKKYSAEELKNLEKKLREANDLIDQLKKN